MIILVVFCIYNVNKLLLFKGLGDRSQRLLGKIPNTRLFSNYLCIIKSSQLPQPLLDQFLLLIYHMFYREKNYSKPFEKSCKA